VRTARWILLIGLTVALFYWKIVFTGQFTILWQWEPVTQSYSWYNFASTWIHKGILPIWDPYRFSGSTFIGEMQTGLFYPLKFLVYIMPLDAAGMVSERIYNEFYVLTHILAVIFTFLLARHLRLSPFASFVAGLSFSLGGYLGNTGHPHTLDSGIWLPLIVLFFLRSTEERSAARGAFFAALSGLALGMAVLAGGIHMVIMGGIVIGTMCVALSAGKSPPTRIFALAAVVAVIGFLFGAVQLLPSMEYGPLSYRWIGADQPIRFQQKVPYQFLGGIARFSPRSLATFLFGAANEGDHIPNNYFGVLPFLLSIIGAWRAWGERWVKYFAVLAIASYIYAWGEFSFLHGVLYLVPGLDVAREAGRFVLVTHFAAAILAAYGIDKLFGAKAPADASMRGFVRGLRWLVVFLTALLIAGAVQTSITILDSFFMSFTFIAAAYAMFELVHRGRRSAATKALVVFLLLWDLYEFNSPIQNRGVMQAQKHDSMADLLDSRKLAGFFKAQGSMFRVHFDGDAPPNIGDSYGIPMTGGMGATMLVDYFGYLSHPRMSQLLNVRYTIRKGDLPGREAVLSDGVWRVYPNADGGKPGWVVHDIEMVPSTERPPKRLMDPAFDAAHVALLERPLQEPIDRGSEPEATVVTIVSNEPNAQEFRVETKGRGVLVTSEVFYPGWQAAVNGHPVTIYRADGILRAVVIPDGQSTITFNYRPSSVRTGAAMTLAAVLATAALGLWLRAGRARALTPGT